MHWFDNPSITHSLPPLYRAYAWYSRLMADRSRSIVRGGSVLLTLVIALTKALRLQAEAAVPIGGVTVFIDLCDRRMLWVFGEVGAPSHEGRIMRACLAEGDTFLDVGANHGSYALMAAPLVGPSGVVAAFEPQPRLASLLRRSFEANRFLHGTVHEDGMRRNQRRVSLLPTVSRLWFGGAAEHFSATTDHRPAHCQTARLDDAIDWAHLPEGRRQARCRGSELSALHGQSVFSSVDGRPSSSSSIR